MPNNYSFVGERVVMARKELDWTQKKLAKETNLSQAIIANIERGRTNILLNHIYAIAAATRKPASWFLEDGD